MSLLLNIIFRSLICIAVACIAKWYLTELSFAGSFNIFQMTFLVSLCVWPLNWRSILLLADLETKRVALGDALSRKPVNSGSRRSVWPEIERARNGMDLATAIQGTEISKYNAHEFLHKYMVKKEAKIQDSLYKGLLPAIAVSGIALASAIVAQRSTSLQSNNPEIALLLSGIVQAYAGSISFLWTVGTLYGEVDLARDIVRAS